MRQGQDGSPRGVDDVDDDDNNDDNDNGERMIMMKGYNDEDDDDDNDDAHLERDTVPCAARSRWVTPWC